MDTNIFDQVPGHAAVVPAVLAPLRRHQLVHLASARALCCCMVDAAQRLQTSRNAHLCDFRCGGRGVGSVRACAVGGRGVGRRFGGSGCICELQVDWLDGELRAVIQKHDEPASAFVEIAAHSGSFAVVMLSSRQAGHAHATTERERHAKQGWVQGGGEGGRWCTSE